MLELQPITYAEACRYIKKHHRHHLPPQGWKFGIACNDGERVVGVVTVGRPVARHLDDGWTLEVTRCCTDGTKNACSKLYSAAWRAAKALGYRRLITYTLADEAGTSVRAAGWKTVGQTAGGCWDRRGRPRIAKGPTGQTGSSITSSRRWPVANMPELAREYTVCKGVRQRLEGLLARHKGEVDYLEAQLVIARAREDAAKTELEQAVESKS